MDQAPIFANFLQNILGVTLNRTLNEITNFIETFDDLISSSYNEINTFLKEVGVQMQEFSYPPTWLWDLRVSYLS